MKSSSIDTGKLKNTCGESFICNVKTSSVEVKNNVTFKPQMKNSTHVSVKDHGNNAHSKSQATGTVYKQQPMFNANTKVFKVAHLNIRSVFPSIDELRLWMKTKPFNILTLSEIWLDESFTENDLSVPGYVFERKDRIKDRYGGVGMYVLQNVHYVRRSDLETDDLECIWIEVIPEHGKNFLVASGYRHSTDSDFFDKFSPIMDKANETNLEIFVLGDLNCDRLKEHSLRDKMGFLCKCMGFHSL